MPTQSLRGGNWDHFPSLLRSALRNRFEPGVRNYDLGFRILTQPAIHHVIRGGAWSGTTQSLGSATRNGLQSFSQHRIMGFRITMESGQ